MMTRTVLFCCLILIAITDPAPCQMGWCWGQDYFRTSVETGVVTIIHENALYNCCPDRFDYAIAQEGNQISVVETEVVSIPCACLCCYALPVAVGPLPPGQYQIDFSWHDYETGDPARLPRRDGPRVERTTGGPAPEDFDRSPAVPADAAGRLRPWPR